VGGNGKFKVVERMDNGNILKEKFEYTKERFQTKQGLVDFFIGTAVFGFIVVNYKDTIFDYLMGIFDVGSPHVQLYLSYLGFGVVMTVIGLTISSIIITTYKKVFE